MTPLPNEKSPDRTRILPRLKFAEQMGALAPTTGQLGMFPAISVRLWFSDAI